VSEEQVRLWKELMRGGRAPSQRFGDFGLVNTKAMFEKASKRKYAIPAYNFYNLEQLRGIVHGCAETSSPAILQVLRRYLDDRNLMCLILMVKGVVNSTSEKGRNLCLALNLDHGNNLEICKKCVDVGFSSVMIDGSALPYDRNVELTKSVADYAHQHEVCVEGELGGIAGMEERATPEHMFTRPREVESFIKETAVDSLAISIGTVHGPFKSKLENKPVQLRFDILDEVRDRVGEFPLVLHGASNVPPEYVEIVNQYGGRIEGATGVGDDQLQTAVRKGIRKANFDTDIKLIFTATARERFAQHPNEFDPKSYLDIAEARLVEYVKNRNRILSAAGKASL
jgi:fructose-bisphosphate aldolase class II